MRSSLRETYNKIASHWANDHLNDAWWVEGTNVFLGYLPPGAHILDVGCGNGWKSRYMLDRGYRVTGIDLSDGMIDLARQQAPEAEFIVMDLADIDQVCGNFDAIFAQAVLLHIPKNDVQQSVRLLTTKLAPGGYMYVAVKDRRPGQAEEEVKIEHDYGFDYARFFSFYSQSEVLEILRAVGLTIVYSTLTRYNTTDWIQVIAQKSA